MAQTVILDRSAYKVHPAPRGKTELAVQLGILAHQVKPVHKDPRETLAIPDQKVSPASRVNGVYPVLMVRRALKATKDLRG